MPKHTLVTIHDVTPALFKRSEDLWRLCRSHDCTPGLLVVPDWHGAWPIEHHAAFLSWLRDRAGEGAEIFLHGERHDEVGLPRSPGDSLRALGRTNREGEFLTLRHAAARARIDRGIARLRRIGLDPIGFVPPAWLARADTHDAVREAGLAVSEDDGIVYHHRTGRRLSSPVLRWSGRGDLRAYGSVLQARLRWELQRAASVMRIALHPADLDHPVTAASLEQALGLWLSERRSTRYADL